MSDVGTTYHVHATKAYLHRVVREDGPGIVGRGTKDEAHAAIDANPHENVVIGECHNFAADGSCAGHPPEELHLTEPEWREVMTVLSAQYKVGDDFLRRVQESRRTGLVSHGDKGRIIDSVRESVRTLEWCEWKPVPDHDPLMRALLALGVTPARPWRDS